MENTYYENINFKGKAITVASHFVLDQDTSHISKTIIDGSQPSNPDSGSVVYFVSGEDTTSVLMGFTITGGTGTFGSVIPPTGPPFDVRSGGGIYVDSEKGSHITWNIIENNSVVSDELGLGGGISAGKPLSSIYTIIENNVIRNNSVSGELDYVGGGAIFMGSNGRINNNTISENLCHSVNYGVAGGAIRLLNMESDVGARFCLIEDNIIKNNQAVSENNNSFGGAVVSSGIRITLKHNQIISNTVKGHIDYSGGGGLYIASLLDGQHVIEGNLFLRNKLDGAYYGGGIALYNSAPIIINNILYSNSARFGGGLFLDNSSNPQIYNNTFFENSASSQGGGIYARNSTLNVMNTIIWNNSSPAGAQIYRTGGSANITYSDIQGGWSGDGNINVDPYFCTDTLFCLSDTSACIDAGNPGMEFNDIEDPENLGYPLWPAKGTLRNDMGVYGWYKLKTAIDPDKKEKQIPLSFVLHQNYPNPFNPVTTIEYQLPNASQVDLGIYNILGQKVATLVSARQPAGAYKVDWDASGFASGIYLYQLRTDNGFVQTRKLVLLK